MTERVARVTCYIGLGSNLGSSFETLDSAIESLREIESLESLVFSSYYQSKPHGPQDQPDYINAVARFSIELAPYVLLDRLQAIEAQHGRVRSGEQWSARTLDLDILLYGNEVINTDRLTVPHAWMTQREFVLYPMYEIQPDLRFPDGSKLAEYLDVISDESLIVAKAADSPD